MGGERHQRSSIGPKSLGSLWRKQQQSTHPLGEELKTWFLCLSLRLKSLELKYLSFALRATGSLTRSLMGVVSTTRQWWSGTGISDCFFKAWRANPTDIAIIMGQFFLLWSTFLITEHKIAKKVIETIRRDQHWILNSMSFDVSVKAFPYFNLLKARIVDVPLCFMTRCLF